MLGREVFLLLLLGLLPTFALDVPRFDDDIPVLILAHNRPELLKVVLTSLTEAIGFEHTTVIVYHDTHHAPTTHLATSFSSVFSNIHYHPHKDGKKISLSSSPSPVPPGGERKKREKLEGITKHYLYALGDIFETYPEVPYVIVLEDDLEVSKDFLEYFHLTANILSVDKSLFCISAYNDNGFPGMVERGGTLQRTGFFPGLGWLLSRELWDTEFKAVIRNYVSWDFSLRDEGIRRGRECIIPEISRTRHLGHQGVNSDIINYRVWSQTVLWGEEDGGSLGKMREGITREEVGRCLPDVYEREVEAMLGGMKGVKSLEEVNAPVLVKDESALLLFDSSAPVNFYPFQEYFGLFPSFGGPIHRTAHNGLLHFFWKSKLIALLDINSPYYSNLPPSLKESTKVFTSVDFDSDLKGSGRGLSSSLVRYRMGEAGQSCDDVCKNRGLVCIASFENLSPFQKCSNLLMFSDCTGCSFSHHEMDQSTLFPYIEENNPKKCFSSGLPSTGCNAKDATKKRICPCEIDTEELSRVFDFVRKNHIKPQHLLAIAVNNAASGQKKPALHLLLAARETASTLTYEEGVTAVRVALAIDNVDLGLEMLKKINTDSTAEKRNLGFVESELCERAGRRDELIKLRMNILDRELEMWEKGEEGQGVGAQGVADLANSIGVHFAMQEKHNEAIEIFEKGLRASPTNRALMTNLARAMAKSHPGGEPALFNAKKLLDMYPGKEAYEILADLYNSRAQGNSSLFFEASKYSKACIESDPGNGFCKNTYTNANCFLNQNVEESLAILDETIGGTHEPSNVAALYITKSRCLRAQKKYEEALDFIHLSLSTAPPSAVSYIHLSSLLLVMRRYDEVLESSQASLRADRNPMVLNKDNPYLSLAVSWLAKGRLDLAIATMNAFQAQNKDYFLSFVAGHVALAEEWAKRGNVEEGLFVLSLVLRVSPQPPSEFFTTLDELCDALPILTEEFRPLCQKQISLATLPPLLPRVTQSLLGKEEREEVQEKGAEEDCMPPVKGGEKRGKGEGLASGVIVYLCCGSDEERDELENSLRLLDRFYLSQFPYDVIIFHEGLSSHHLASLQEAVGSIVLQFELLTFQLPQFLDGSAIPSKVGPYGMGYRHMCRFFSIHLWSHPAVLSYEYIWRLDSDSYFYDYVSYDLFAKMEEEDLDYGYLGSFRDNPLYTSGLQASTLSYLQKTYPKQELSNILSRHHGWNAKYLPLSAPEDASQNWEDACFHTHFTIARRSLWTNKRVLDYLQHLDVLGGIFYNRWGDACIHYYIVSLFVEEQKVLHISDLPYWHQQFLLSKGSSLIISALPEK